MKQIKVGARVIYKNAFPEYDRPMTVTKIEKNIYVYFLDGEISKLIHVDNLRRSGDEIGKNDNE